jgi:hypothetical protein
MNAFLRGKRKLIKIKSEQYSMKRLTYLIATLLVLISSGYTASAQYYFYDNNHYDNPLMFEIGGSIGIMNCLTDIGGQKGVGKPFIKDLNLGDTRFNGSVYLSATYKESVALRLEGTFGTVSAYDSILSKVASSTSGRYERNLSFKSKIAEISLLAEFYPFFIFGNYMGRDVVPPLWSPYLIGGVGLFSFNPQAKARNGQYVDLQPLSTEGQGFIEYPDRQPYKLVQINIPVGIGVKYELSHNLNLRAEFLHRFLFTDYLDDVSKRYINPSYFSSYFSGVQLQNALDLSTNDRHNPGGPTGMFRKTETGIRGNPKDNDAYFTFNIKIGLTFGRQKIR